MNGEEERATNDSVVARTPIETTGEFALQRRVDWGRSITTFIVEHPELCLGIALALGVAIGVAVKRR